MNTWLNASVYFLACFLSFSQRETGQGPGSYQMQGLLSVGSSWVVGAWRLISYVLAVFLNLSQVSALGTCCRLTDCLTQHDHLFSLNCWCSWALPFDIDSGSMFLPPNFSWEQMEQKPGYRFLPQPRLSCWTYWKMIYSVWGKLRHHSLCSEPVMSHLPLLLIAANCKYFSALQTEYLKAFKCTGEPVGSTEIQIWHINQLWFYLLLPNIWLENLDAAVNLCGSADLKGISDCDLICLSLSFDLLCKTLVLYAGRVERNLDEGNYWLSLGQVLSVCKKW